MSSVTTRSRPLPCPNERLPPTDGVDGEDLCCHSGDPGLTTSSKSEENSCSISRSMSHFCWAMKEIVMRCSRRRILEREGRSSGARRMQSIIRPLNPSGTCPNRNETTFYAQRNHGNKVKNFRSQNGLKPCACCCLHRPCCTHFQQPGCPRECFACTCRKTRVSGLIAAPARGDSGAACIGPQPTPPQDCSPDCETSS